VKETAFAVGVGRAKPSSPHKYLTEDTLIPPFEFFSNRRGSMRKVKKDVT
jgi:hypothetical protein